MTNGLPSNSRSERPFLRTVAIVCVLASALSALNGWNLYDRTVCLRRVYNDFGVKTLPAATELAMRFPYAGLTVAIVSFVVGLAAVLRPRRAIATAALAAWILAVSLQVCCTNALVDPFFRIMTSLSR